MIPAELVFLQFFFALLAPGWAFRKVSAEWHTPPAQRDRRRHGPRPTHCTSITVVCDVIMPQSRDALDDADVIQRRFIFHHSISFHIDVLLTSLPQAPDHATAMERCRPRNNPRNIHPSSPPYHPSSQAQNMQ